MNMASLNPLNWFKKNDRQPFQLPSVSTYSTPWSPLLSGYSPGINLLESADEYLIELAVPGLTRDDLTIELQDQQLIISGAQTQQQSVDLSGRQWSVARAGFFQRCLALPADARTDLLKANLAHGLLTIRVGRDAIPVHRRRRITLH